MGNVFASPCGFLVRFGWSWNSTGWGYGLHTFCVAARGAELCVVGAFTSARESPAQMYKAFAHTTTKSGRTRFSSCKNPERIIHWLHVLWCASVGFPWYDFGMASCIIDTGCVALTCLSGVTRFPSSIPKGAGGCYHCHSNCHHHL